MLLKFKTIPEFFHFTRKERNGIIVLLCVIFILTGINIVLPYLIKNKQVDTSGWEAEVDQYLERKDNQSQQVLNRELKPFNPNKSGIEELTAMDVPHNVASNWIKYLDKGGHFDKATDIRKIYGMTPDLYNRLESYIRISNEVNHHQKINKSLNSISNSAKPDKVEFNFFNNSLTAADSVELNLADSAALENLPGIGTILAPRIIRYRNLLGGFYSVAQLCDVYGLREEHFRAASAHLYVNGEILRRININFASTGELGRHLYIGFRTAGKIVKLRDEKGKYYSVKDLSGIMSADSIARLSPYLKFSE